VSVGEHFLARQWLRDFCRCRPVLPNPSLKSVIFWQWANQSLNGERLFPGVLPQLLTAESRGNLHAISPFDMLIDLLAFE
jgi:hypothetical protein